MTVCYIWCKIGLISAHLVHKSDSMLHLLALSRISQHKLFLFGLFACFHADPLSFLCTVICLLSLLMLVAAMKVMLDGLTVLVRRRCWPFGASYYTSIHVVQYGAFLFAWRPSYISFCRH
jgi:hypothetical protein